jgi:hypothetical protein
LLHIDLGSPGECSLSSGHVVKDEDGDLRSPGEPSSAGFRPGVHNVAGKLHCGSLVTSAKNGVNVLVRK